MEEREEIRRKREKGREADDSRTGRRKDGIRCRGKDIRKGRIASGRIETGAEIQGGAQNKEKAGIQCRGIDIRKGRHPIPGKRRKK